jgi:Rps23 Pro-64 3,4-dihydroxylase Tpa1-like proline 4-hydroxylase
MELTLLTPQFAVFDNVLPPENFAQVVEYFESEDYALMHADGVKGILRPEDGNPFQRKRVFFYLAVPISTLVPREEQVAEVRRNVDLYPTGSPLDPLFEIMHEKAVEHPELYGEEKKDWIAISGKMFVYPAGTGASWHNDGGMYRGAFIYYTHPRWDAQWGGQLLVADASARETHHQLVAEQAKAWAGEVHRERKHYFGSPVLGDEALMKRGIGSYVMPLPNRLVLLSGDNAHMVAKVNAAAGNHCRMSIAGFFLTPAAMADTLSPLNRGKARY